MHISLVVVILADLGALLTVSLTQLCSFVSLRGDCGVMT